MKWLSLSLCLFVACSLPNDLDLERNNPIDPGATSSSSRCGNGKANAGEACDDGNQDDVDACTNTCVLARCGDGIVRQGLSADEPGYEACDDGNDVTTDGCLNDCSLSRCGDAVARADLVAGDEGFEACDDGNTVNTDTCTNACLPATCGDGFIQESNDEECDDGNTEEGDDCSASCRLGGCGDGLIQRGEECDAGPDTDDLFCTNCRLRSCSSGCFETNENLHCLRVPVDGGERFVHACLRAVDRLPTALPGRVGICVDQDAEFTHISCSTNQDCEEGNTCEARVAWHRCLPEDRADEISGYFQPCLPGNSDCPRGLGCREAVADRWDGFCQVGRTEEGWNINGYRAKISQQGEAVCYPLACANRTADNIPGGLDPSCSCPELNDYQGTPTHNTYASGADNFPETAQGICLWEECKEGADSSCSRHGLSGEGREAECQVSNEVCGYGEEHPLQALDLTHPTGMMRFEERCDMACNQRGAACEFEVIEVSPVAQARCVVCGEGDECPDHYSCFEFTEDEERPPAMGYCLLGCRSDNDCDGDSHCHESHCIMNRDFDLSGEGRSTRPAPVPCQDSLACAGNLTCEPVGPGMARFCQGKACRSEWDCPVTQVCGMGQCRGDFNCRVNGCPRGSTCHQSSMGYEFRGSCESDSDCDHDICLGGMCLMDVDVGSCRLASAGSEDREMDHNFRDEWRLVEHSLIEFPNGWAVNFTPSGLGGLIGLRVKASADTECFLETDNNQRTEPLELSYRHEAGNSCQGWYAVEGGEDYSMRVFPAHAEDELMREVRPAQIEVSFVSDAEKNAYCSNQVVQSWEGCYGASPALGCENCRCIEPDWGDRDDVDQPLRPFKQTGGLGCDHGREDAFLRRVGQGDDQEFVYHIEVVGQEVIPDDGELICRVNVGETEFEGRMWGSNACNLEFTSQNESNVQFFAYWQTDNLVTPLEAMVLVGKPCTDSNDCNDAPHSQCRSIAGAKSLCVDPNAN